VGEYFIDPKPYVLRVPLIEPDLPLDVTRENNLSITHAFILAKHVKSDIYDLFPRRTVGSRAGFWAEKFTGG